MVSLLDSMRAHLRSTDDSHRVTALELLFVEQQLEVVTRWLPSVERRCARIESSRETIDQVRVGRSYGGGREHRVRTELIGRPGAARVNGGCRPRRCAQAVRWPPESRFVGTRSPPPWQKAMTLSTAPASWELRSDPSRMAHHRDGHRRRRSPSLVRTPTRSAAGWPCGQRRWCGWLRRHGTPLG